MALHQLTPDALARLRTWRHAPAWVWGLVGTSLFGLGATVAIGGGLLLVPMSQRTTGTAQALSAIDATLVQAYATLPKATQEQLKQLPQNLR